MTGIDEAARLARLRAAAFGDRDGAWSDGAFAALLGSPGVFAVALDDPESGYAIGRVAADEAELLSIGVPRTRTGAGFGQRLLAAFEGEARARGAETAFLEVSEENVAALALYRGAGYGEVARRPAYYRGPGRAPVNAIVMRKALARWRAGARAVPAGSDSNVRKRRKYNVD